MTKGGSAKGFTLIELMIVIVIVGVLAAFAIPNLSSMTQRSKVARVKSVMHTVQIAVEDFSARNDNGYPPNVTATTSDGGLTLDQLLPQAQLPYNPFTDAPTVLEWSNTAGTVPTGGAGAVSLNVFSIAGPVAYDSYDILGADDVGTVLDLVLTNQ